MKCHDCPDLAYDVMVARDKSWKPRATCCCDDHIERRLNGSPEAWRGHEAARQRADEVEASKSRQQRRWEQRKGRPA
jgi:hypothetical protein